MFSIAHKLRFFVRNERVIGGVKVITDSDLFTNRQDALHVGFLISEIDDKDFVYKAFTHPMNKNN